MSDAVIKDGLLRIDILGPWTGIERQFYVRKCNRSSGGTKWFDIAESNIPILIDALTEAMNRPKVEL